ncbi:MAG: GNAT family N-acetyltransferase [Chloroflexi bacterium]|nr:GNAT family N-acetyltransferase [Chloroflexota bacterium]
MIHIRPFRPRDLAAATALFNEVTASWPYHWPLTTSEFQSLMLYDMGDPALKMNADPSGWFVAVAGQQLLGLAHACFSGRYLDVAPPQGWLRALLIKNDAPAQVAQKLLQAVDRYFHDHGIAEVTAFSPAAGYPCLLAGRGILPGDRLDLIRAMGESGYHLQDRWLLYERRIHKPLSEQLPEVTPLRLHWQSATGEQLEFWLHDGHAAIAHIRIHYLSELSQHLEPQSASLSYLFVAEKRQRRGVGRWLLQRSLNELLARHIHRLIIHINHHDAAAQGLLLQLGFDELPLRGYTYEKNLS